MREWCKEANSANSKSLLIRRNGKTWRLSIVEEEPKDGEKGKRRRLQGGIKWNVVIK